MSDHVLTVLVIVGLVSVIWSIGMVLYLDRRQRKLQFKREIQSWLYQKCLAQIEEQPEDFGHGGPDEYPQD